MTGGLEVADVFRRYGPAWRAERGDHLDRMQRRVMGAIEACRTAALGGHVQSLRRLRPHRYRLQLLPQPALPEVPGPGAGGLGRRASRRAAARALLPRCLHPAGSGRRDSPWRDRIPEQGDRLRHPVPRRRGDAAPHRRRPAPSRRRHRRRRGAARAWGQAMQHHPHVHCIVPGGGLSPDRTRWVACPPGFFLSVKVLARLFRRLFLERLAAAFARGAALLRPPRSRARRLRRPLRDAAPDRLGSLRQAPLRRPRTGARLSRPRHPSRRHRQQPADRHGRRESELPLEGLSPGGAPQGHDARGRRVHAPVPAARPAARLPSDPPLRLSRQRRSRGTARPFAAGCSPTPAPTRTTPIPSSKPTQPPCRRRRSSRTSVRPAGASP